MTTLELIEKGIGHNCLSDAYDLGRADMTKQEQRLELLVYRIKDKCYEEAEKLLKEYSKQIRADAIDEFLHSINKLDRFWFANKDKNPITPKMVDYEGIQKIAEQLKEQT